MTGTDPNPDRPDLSALCAEWQARLRLQDWDIEVERVRHFRVGEARLGEIEVLRSKRAAKIRVLFPEDEEPGSWPTNDEETTVVHELLHIHFDPLEPPNIDWSSPVGIAIEQAVHALSVALITLKREAHALQEPRDGEGVLRQAAGGNGRKLELQGVVVKDKAATP